ncbi:PREDICTED: C-type lectin domain family 4 member C-like [Cyprinodon variegatus]|uniref:C-type lectin domain family 4 member C-like n=1 Tax=Cyprinodon variegatus TaxID=28743 RepID=UPI000742C89C|nr:PREDICTED: C-type lectin domain family 4 member C-like [Cyprinodon variegatus]
MALLSVVGLVDIGVRLKTCLSDIEEPQKTCFENPSDWQEIRTSRLFYTSTEKKNWTESRKDCQRRGGDLVIINSKEKQDILRRMKLHGDSWIGLQSVSTGGWGAKAKWKWVDGSEPQYV